MVQFLNIICRLTRFIMWTSAWSSSDNQVWWEAIGGPPLAGPEVRGRLAGARQRSASDVRERRLAKFRQNVARFRLYRLRFLQENMRFAAFFKIYQILKLKFLKFDKILQILRHLQLFC